jgi:hypothetical protein
MYNEVIEGKMDKTVIRKIKLENLKSDFEFWQKQPITSRLAALQTIREEYIGWKYDNRQGFQRVWFYVN